MWRSVGTLLVVFVEFGGCEAETLDRLRGLGAAPVSSEKPLFEAKEASGAGPHFGRWGLRSGVEGCHQKDSHHCKFLERKGAMRNGDVTADNLELG